MRASQPATMSSSSWLPKARSAATLLTTSPPRWRPTPPLRMANLGVTALVIAGTFLAAAGLEAALSPVAGRAADRRGAIVPIRCSLTGAVAISLLAPTLASAWVLIPVLIVGMPSFGTLFTPAMTLVSEGAQHQRLDQGLAFGLGNLAWAAGQAVAAAGSGALAQATSDLVPYSLLAAACLATLGFTWIGLGQRQWAVPR